jgi:two-component system sensor histidine kinase MprB
MSLRTRIALIASAAVAVAVLAIAVTVYVAAEDRLVDEVDRSLTNRLGTPRAISALRDEISQRGPRRGPFQAPRGFDVIYLQLADSDGRTWVPAGQEVVLPTFTIGTGREGYAIMTEATVDDIHLRIANVELVEGSGVIQIARSLEEVDATLASLAWTLSLIGLVGIAGAALLGLFVARSSLRPIGKLTEAAEKVAATKQLAERIDVDRADELGRLAGAFNEMMEALEGSREQQRRLVRDAGHELRTPLTALRTNIEFLAKADELPEAAKAAVYADLSTELAELTDLVNEVVEVAAEADVAEPETDIDLGQMADEVVNRFRRRVSQSLELQVESAASLYGRRTSLERALGNLIDNAIKWSPSDAPIIVRVNGSRIVVEDRGPGIAPEDRERVFDRFYRAPAARSKPGSGLGLSIVKQVVDTHAGLVFTEESATGATVVGFELPMTTPGTVSGDS